MTFSDLRGSVFATQLNCRGNYLEHTAYVT